MPRKYSSSAVLGVTVALAVVLAGLTAGGPQESGGSLAQRIVPVGVSLGMAATSVVAVLLVRADRRRYRAERRRYRAALRAKEVERALNAERLAIARDLHDIVSHGLGLMTMRASIAATVEEDADSLRSALRDVEEVSRSTTLEMRRMVRVLRGESPPLGPLPGIEAIGELVARARSSGLDASLTGQGTTAHSAGVAIAAYRIVQEALANVARHAGPARVRVSLGRDEGDLLVSVTDDGGSGLAGGPVGQGSGSGSAGGSARWGSGLAPGGGHAGQGRGSAQAGESAGKERGSGLAGGYANQEHGSGLAGLAERVAALGGRLSSGPRPAGGFFVEARIPDGAAAGPSQPPAVGPGAGQESHVTAGPGQRANAADPSQATVEEPSRNEAEDPRRDDTADPHSDSAAAHPRRDEPAGPRRTCAADPRGAETADPDGGPTPSEPDPAGRPAP